MPTYLTPGVYIEETQSGSMPLSAVGTAVAAFVGYTAKVPTDDPKDPDGLRPRMVTNWSQYMKLYGGFTNSALLPLAVYGFFLNGGGRAYIVRIPHHSTARQEITAAKDVPILDFVNICEDGEVTVEVAPAKDKAAAHSAFDVHVSGPNKVVETYESMTLLKGDAFNVATRINNESKLIEVMTHVDVATPMVAKKYPLAAPKPATVKPADFEGDAEKRVGLEGLVIAEDVTMVMMPDLYTAAMYPNRTEPDLELWKTAQSALVTYCTNAGKLKFIPPSGHVAGVWARTDQTRGVWKAPANELIAGVLKVQNEITKGEQEILNPNGINAIRSFGSRGLRVWGARTLSSDPSWKYINVRRLFNMVESTILEGTQWVVFEPNDQTLWQRVNRTVYAFLLGLWREGALFGASPSEAFFVKCDAETNPPESIDEGKLVVEIGIAPVKPAEFVIFRFSQKTLESATA